MSGRGMTSVRERYDKCLGEVCQVFGRGMTRVRERYDKCYEWYDKC